MDQRGAFINMRTILAELYPTESDVRMVVYDVGLNGSRISFSAKAAITWHDILTIANNTGKLDALLEFVLRPDQFGNNANLQHAITLYQSSIRNEQPASPLAEPSQNHTTGVPALPNRERVLGRDALLDDLVNRLRTGKSPALSIDGMPGVGKTTMAILVTHDPRILDYFVDGILWAGLGQTPDITNIQSVWAEQLGVDLRDVDDPRRRQERLNAAIGQKRLLVVLDDVWQPEAARLLFLSGPNIGHLLTTRNSNTARRFAGAEQTVKVPILEDNTAWELLQRLAPEACAFNPDAARTLVDKVGGLPLAVQLLGSYLAEPRQMMFADLREKALADLNDPIRRLELAKDRLGNIEGGTYSLESIIGLSIEAITRVDASAVDALYQLANLATKPDTIDIPTAIAVTGGSSNTLAILNEYGLLEVGIGESLSIHQVIADVAKARQGKTEKNAPDVEQALLQSITDIARVDTIIESAPTEKLKLTDILELLLRRLEQNEG